MAGIWGRSRRRWWRSRASIIGKGSFPALKLRLLTLTVILANVIGNFALSWGMKHSSGDLLPRLLDPFVIGGIALLIFWTMTKVTLLSMADLSYVLPVTSVGYALNAVAGWIFLSERISGARWGGIALITLGALLVSRTAPTKERDA